MYRFRTFLLPSSYYSCSCKDMTETRVLYCNFCFKLLLPGWLCLEKYISLNWICGMPSVPAECVKLMCLQINQCANCKLIAVGEIPLFSIHCCIIFTFFLFTAAACGFCSCWSCVSLSNAVPVLLTCSCWRQHMNYDYPHIALLPCASPILIVNGRTANGQVKDSIINIS